MLYRGLVTTNGATHDATTSIDVTATYNQHMLDVYSVNTYTPPLTLESTLPTTGAPGISSAYAVPTDI